MMGNSYNLSIEPDPSQTQGHDIVLWTVVLKSGQELRGKLFCIMNSRMRTLDLAEQMQNEYHIGSSLLVHPLPSERHLQNL